MNKISCDVCMDLLPLVKDDVASEDSKVLVQNHIKECKNCQDILKSFEEIPKMNEEKIINKIKKQLFTIAIIIISLGGLVGLALSESMGMFYNILIMPTIGAIGYFTLKRKAYLVPLTLLVFSYIWLLVKYIAEGMFIETPMFYGLTIPLYWGMIYSGLCVLGILIGFLLDIAFRKEKKI